MKTRLLYIFALALLPLVTSAQWLDFSKSSIYCTDKKNILLFKATTVLQEELLLHTHIKPAIAGKLDSKDLPQIVICLEKAVGVILSTTLTSPLTMHSGCLTSSTGLKKRAMRKSGLSKLAKC